MIEKKLEGLLSSPFFVPLKNNGSFDKETIKKEVELIFEKKVYANNKNQCYYELLCEKVIDNFYFYKDREQFIKLAEEVVVKVFVEEDLIDYILLPEECNKIRDLVAKKQFDSKIIKSFASDLSNFLCDLDGQSNTLGNIFILDLNKKIKEFKDKEILKKYKNLKDIVDKITSGVSRNCYFNMEYYGGFVDALNPKINSYIYDKHGYNIDNYEGALLYNRGNDYKILQSCLNCGDNFNITRFLNNIYKFNDLKHVEKIVDYCFSEFSKTEKGKFIYDNKLPLDYIYNIEDRVIDFSVDWLYRRILKISDTEISYDDAKGLIYPIYSNYEKEISEGKETFDKFLECAYEDKASIIKNIFKDTDNIIQDASGNKRKLSLAIMLDAHIVGYWDKSLEKKYLYNYYKNFGSNENILKRFYYVIYLISKYISDAVNESIYEYMYDILNMINVKYNVTCAYTVNNELRENNYDKLKTLLAKYGVNVEDSYKEKYIIALLDRKYATANESVYFPELEMLGDAIYDLAISEILFYTEEEYDLKKENIAKARSQVEVAKSIGLDKLYISNLISDFTSKYEDYGRIELGLDYNRNNNYIADSLEMVIGVIYQEFGLVKALDFSTKIILDSSDCLNKPLKLNFDEAIKSNLDTEYLEKIFPCLFNHTIDDNYNSYSQIWDSLTKLLMTLSVGTDSVEKRTFITNNHRVNQLIFNDSSDGYSYQRILGYYLYNGIEKTYEFFKQEIKDDYEKLNK